MRRNGIYKNCLTCDKVFYAQMNIINIGKGKYCSKKCSDQANIGKTAWWVKMGKDKLSNTGKTRFTKERLNDPEFKEKRIANIPRGENHPKWLGDSVGYTALHDWVRKILGSPKECGNCGTTEKRMYHWANISGAYKRDIDDWVRLCVPCHKKFDLNRIKFTI